MWLPTTKTTLVNELYLIWQWHYKRWEIERVYHQELDRIPERNKYYARKAGVKKLQAFLIRSRDDIKQMDGDIDKLQYSITLKQCE